MATIWSLVANWLVPIPLGLFLLTSLPLPRNVRRGTLIFTQRVFDVPIMGSFKLLHVMLWLTAVAFLSSARQVHLFHEQKEGMTFTTPNAEISFLSKRWRAERNLWLSAFAFSAWAFLAAFYREAVRRLEADARLQELLERSEITATEPGRGDREASIGREVTSKAAARTPAGTASPNKSAAPSAPAEVATVGDAAGSGAGIQMQELKKEL
ncbi:hypothetical protein ABPG77_000368 [Micractinium sp. CCAP 211/92]